MNKVAGKAGASDHGLRSDTSSTSILIQKLHNLASSASLICKPVGCLFLVQFCVLTNVFASNLKCYRYWRLSEYGLMFRRKNKILLLEKPCTYS